MTDLSCDNLSSPNPWVLSLSIFLVVGILVSYLPQHVKIIQNGTSAGLSPYWVLLGALSSIAGMTNILVLPASRHDVACCREISGTSCAAAVLGIVQIGVQWICFMMILILYLVYFPQEPDRTPDDTANDSLARNDSPRPRPLQAVLVGATNLTALLLAGIVTLILVSRAPSLLLPWANFVGATAGILSCIQYLPQIYTTFKLQHLLSLSILTLLIQVPGGFLFAFSLFLRVGWEGWSAWLVYCVTATCQAVLLGMASSFYIRDSRVSSSEDSGIGPRGSKDHSGRGAAGIVPRIFGGEEENSPSERDPLLARNSLSRHSVRAKSGGRTNGGTDIRRSAYDGSTLRTIHGHSRHDHGNNGAKNPIGLLYSASPPDDSSFASDVESSPASHNPDLENRAGK